MTPELTAAVHRALAAAQRWAEHAGTDIEPRHLLLGLLEEDEGRSVLLLQAQGLDADRVREALTGNRAAALPAVSRPEAPASIPPHFITVLTRARLLASDLAGETTVASEHLLLALLHQEEALRRRLESLGFHLPDLEAALRVHDNSPLPLEEPLALVEPTEQIDLARILDANANRAREGLRVVEEYCRFALEDAFLSGELKRLRHELAAALDQLSPTLLLEARETERDVGTGLRTASEERRDSLLDVVRANLKRLQESLRSLEEYGKVHNADLGRSFEALRYRAYTLERAILLGTHSRDRLADARLYVLVTGALCQSSLEWTIKEAVAGGAQIIQLREKQLADRPLLERAREVRRWTREVGALFIVNDRPDIARLVEADGVHVGQDEMPVKEARRIVGRDALIGVSTHNLDQLRQAILDGASYVGVGPTFASATKEFEEFAGLPFVRQAAAETSLPAFAIGGVTPANAHEVVAAGLRRVAVSHAVCQAEDPRAVAHSLRILIDSS